MKHRFRFFVDASPLAAGDQVALRTGDAGHARVLRLADGDAVEVVDGAGAVWDAVLAGAGELVEVTARLDDAGLQEPVIELVAGALSGGRFDELVDGAVQAGATRIVPFAAVRRDADRLAQRRERLSRIAAAAAKQAKRTLEPTVEDPIDAAALHALAPGIVLDAGAAATLDAVLSTAPAPDAPRRLMVGPAEGLPAELLQRLVADGWRTARLGPSVLRAELAAAVAVAITAMHASDRRAER